MITYEVAYETAKKLKPSIDNCVEYENGYVFGCHADDEYEGTKAPCVIMKKDGKATTMPYFIAMGTGSEIRSFEIE